MSNINDQNCNLIIHIVKCLGYEAFISDTKLVTKSRNIQTQKKHVHKKQCQLLSQIIIINRKVKLNLM